MSKEKKQSKKDKKQQAAEIPVDSLKPVEQLSPADQARKAKKQKSKLYEKELKRLHVELVKLQEWVVAKGLKVVVVFEGRDAAGKGGLIKAITGRVSPRVFKVVALPAPGDREKSQLYVQRYIQHFPAAGEIVIFDRSWYNRAGVECVMGFTAGHREEFLGLFRCSRTRWRHTVLSSQILA